MPLHNHYCDEAPIRQEKCNLLHFFLRKNATLDIFSNEYYMRTLFYYTTTFKMQNKEQLAPLPTYSSSSFILRCSKINRSDKTTALQITPISKLCQ